MHVLPITLMFIMFNSIVCCLFSIQLIFVCFFVFNPPQLIILFEDENAGQDLAQGGKAKGLDSL